MQGLDIEEVRLAGKPKVDDVVRTDKTIRYPTEARTLQHAVDMCVAGDHISVMPGVYNESAIIHVDLDIHREGQYGQVVFVSRNETALLVEGSEESQKVKVTLTNIGLCVEEGALMHHALQVDRAHVELDGCEVFGGLYACFASNDSFITAKQTRFHSAYSFGLTLLNSSGTFHDCFIFRNKEDGLNICGGTSKASFYRCRMSDNTCHGMHVHKGADVEMEITEVVRNGQHGIAITGSDDQFEKRGEGDIKPSCVKLSKCEVRNNEWHGILIVDGSAVIEDCDLRKNARGALTLCSSKGRVQKDVDRTNAPFFSIDYYNSFQETGEVELVGENPGVRPDGENEFTLPGRLPLGWDKFSKERLLNLFRICPPEVQSKLYGHPPNWFETEEGWENVQRDPQAAIRIKAELRAWIEREADGNMDEEIDLPVRDFLAPLGLDYMAERFVNIGCLHVRDLMSITNYDLENLSMKNADDRKVLLSRLAVNADMGTGPKFIKEMKLQSLIDATKFQAKRGEKKGTFKEWRKLRNFLLKRIGVGVAGAELDKNLRELYRELDVDNSAGSDGIDVNELRVGIQRFGINLASIDVDFLIEEALPEGEETMSFDRFCNIVQHVLHS